MKSLFTISLLALAFNAFAIDPVIDLKVEGRRIFGNKYIKTLDANEDIAFQFADGRSHYVEQLFISAEGAQSQYSFAKVYADGDEVATLGVPGRDPDYPVVIRGNVSEIVLKVQNKSRVKILGFKIYTERKTYSSYRGMDRAARRSMTLERWGSSILDLVAEFQSQTEGMPQSEDMFDEHLRPLKKAALKLQASDDARDVRSLSTKRKAVDLISAIDKAIPLFEEDIFLVDSRFDRLALDLQTIRQDIIEKYDLDLE